MSDIEIPEFTKQATFGEIMPASVTIAKAGDHAAGRRYVQAYVDYLIAEWEHTPESAFKTVLDNIGYWAGYYGSATMRLVHEFYGAQHPVFGTRQPTMEEAFDAGFLMAAGIEPEGRR